MVVLLHLMMKLTLLVEVYRPFEMVSAIGLMILLAVVVE